MAITWKINELTATGSVGHPDVYWWQKGREIFVAQYSCSDGTSEVIGDIGIEPEKDRKDLTEAEVLSLVKTRISQNMNGTTSLQNIKHIEEEVVARTAAAAAEDVDESLPWN